ncbi:MAG: SLC13 family permease [Bacteroidales bacterium]|nr:SLC13 family permease [Bacteroidales bacterium]
MYITIAILIIATIFFVNGKIRADVVSLCAMLALMLFQIVTPEEALSGFSNPVVVMMIGLFVVGGAIFQTGLAKSISTRILGLAGTSETRLFFLVMIVTSCFGAFVSNTGTVAVMLPIIVSLAAGANMSPSRLLMPLAFASSMGGMLTLLGTPPNLIISDTLEKAGRPALQFFSFAPSGIVCIVVGTLVLWPLSKWFLSKRVEQTDSKKGRGKTPGQLIAEYGLADNLFRLRVPSKAAIIGKTIAQLDLRNNYAVNILEVRRGDAKHHRFLKTITQHMASGQMTLEKGDILYVTGRISAVNAMVDDLSFELLNEHETEVAIGQGKAMDFYDIGIAELLIMPTSSFINKNIKEAGFRDKFSLNVLGIRRKGEYILHELGEENIHDGDVLLVQGTWENITRLTKESINWIVLGQPQNDAAGVTLEYKAPVVAAIMIAMIAAMVFDFIPVAPVTAVITAALMLVLTGCFRNVSAAYKTINWESIMLIGGMMPMSIALEKTGTSHLISEALVGTFGQYGPMALMAGIYMATSLMTMFISNTATAVLLAPIALQSASQMSVAPEPFLFAVSIGASMCFASPFSTPPNALVMPAGQYTFMDYIKVGLPLQIIMGIVMVLILPLLFPF